MASPAIEEEICQNSRVRAALKRPLVVVGPSSDGAGDRKADSFVVQDWHNFTLPNLLAWPSSWVVPFEICASDWITHGSMALIVIKSSSHSRSLDRLKAALLAHVVHKIDSKTNISPLSEFRVQKIGKYFHKYQCWHSYQLRLFNSIANIPIAVNVISSQKISAFVNWNGQWTICLGGGRGRGVMASPQL